MSETRKVVLITGAARRIGNVIASFLHEKGFNVVIHYHHSVADAQTLADRLNLQRPNSAVTVQADLSNNTKLDHLLKNTMQAWGRLDALVNNASAFYATSFTTTTEANWDDLLATNLKTPYFLAQKCLPHLQQVKGCIINIADIHGVRPMREYSPYCIAKAGLIMLTQALAKELSPTVRVNAVSPGPILWPEGENQLAMDMKTEIIRRTPLQKLGEPLEVAKLVHFLIADGSHITGQNIAVDGGRLLHL